MLRVLIEAILMGIINKQLLCRKSEKNIDICFLTTLSGSNYPCLEQIFMVPKMFEPLKFSCILYLLHVFGMIGLSKHASNKYPQHVVFMEK